MKAEIISVGTELLLGHTINSDAAHIARGLAEFGIDLTHTQVVGDNEQRLFEALQLAAARCDLIITSGGLGPTKDDLTKETVAKFAGLALVNDQSTLERIKKYFGSAPMTDNQLKQALAPEGSVIFPNDYGTAPGMAVPFDQHKFVVLLPGPPKELLPMWKNYVEPFLAKLTNATIVSRIIRTFGIGEGDCAARLGDLLDGINPTVAPYASEGEMFLKVTAKAKDSLQAHQLIEPIVVKIQQILGDVIYGVDKENLEQVVVELLCQNKLKISTAESCTGGLLAKRITDIPGASAIFDLGVISYANCAKEKILNVPETLLNKVGAVSPEVAEKMATGILNLAGSDFGIGITGIAGPDGGTPEKPVGLVYIALATKNNINILEMRPKGKQQTRSWIRRRAASNALDMLRRHLLGLPQKTNDI